MTVVRDKFLLRGDIWFDGEPEEIALVVHKLLSYLYKRWHGHVIAGCGGSGVAHPVKQ